jgi:hypothetical protein
MTTTASTTTPARDHGTVPAMVGLASLHPMAYGLDRDQHRKIARAARNHYTDGYLSSRWGISVEAVRAICGADGYVPPHNAQRPDGTWDCQPGHEVNESMKRRAVQGGRPGGRNV